MIAVLYGVLFYGWSSNPFGGANIDVHFIYMIAVSLISGVALALILSLLFGKKPIWGAYNVFSRKPLPEGAAEFVI